jgi:hypothetical protein
MGQGARSMEQLYFILSLKTAIAKIARGKDHEAIMLYPAVKNCNLVFITK